ncbi:hypothetical protein [Zooshikella ganghwensis]|uniref:Uncharacterized protein n=1 Tax=Zooshikella ganghwensis TaxID=202772 RepID=A0A4P9VE13_9GAMM|nr:hypothetical protein [Zooshikella ganghwensis]RDH41286.1 hypothetical protein B9G39_28875 [Zooshikella ganghwensis]RDH41295.1 hypothetical protein B9G39_28920 [Zooshikella ganghwensis]
MDSDRVIKELDQYLSNFWDKDVVQQTQIIIELLEQNGVPVSSKSDYLSTESILNDVNHVFQKLKLTDPIYCLTINEVWLCFMYLPLHIHHVANYLYQAYTTGEVYDVSSLLGYD